jgi:epsilon-lactone hydrolase
MALASAKRFVEEGAYVFIDSRCYVERAVAAGVDAERDVWMGMRHGFVGSVGKLHAANQALLAIGAFLSDRLEGAR